MSASLVDQLAFPGLVAGLAASLALGPACWVAQVGLAFAMVALYLNISILHALWCYRHIPGPMPLPVLGNIVALRKADLHVVYGKWQAKYGPVFKMFIGSSVVVVFCDVDSVREIGLRRFSCFTNRDNFPNKLGGFLPPAFRTTRKYGMLRAKDAYWKGIRSTANSIFRNVHTLSSFCPLMKETADELVDRLAELKEGETIDIWRAFGDMTLDVVGSTVFGVRFNAVQKKGADAVKAARIIFKNASVFGRSNPYLSLAMISPSFCIPFLKVLAEKFPTRDMKENYWAAGFLGNVSDEMYQLAQQDQGRADTAAEAPEGKLAGDYDYSGNSFLKLFVNGHSRETGANLTKDEVVSQAFTFLLAGYETTASTLGFAIYALTKHKDKEQALIEEIDRLGEGSSALPTIDELTEYKYLDAVLSEVLRMHGPATVFTRVASEDVLVNGVAIFKDTGVHMHSYAMHWNPKYFPSPEDFVPERFLESHELYKLQNHKAFMPFGLGPRMCVAAKFAQTEAKLALITLYRKYRFEYNPKHNFKEAMSITLSPVNGVEVFVHKRHV